MIGPAILMLAMQAAEPAQRTEAAPPAGWSQGEWITVHRDEGSLLEVDRTATRREGRLVRARVRAEFPGLHRGVRWGLVSFELDCAADTIRTLGGQEFGPDGALLSTRDSPEAEPRPASEVALPIYRQICREAGWRADSE